MCNASWNWDRHRLTGGLWDGGGGQLSVLPLVFWWSRGVGLKLNTHMRVKLLHRLCFQQIKLRLRRQTLALAEQQAARPCPENEKDPRLILSSFPGNCSWFPLCVSCLTHRSFQGRAWRRAHFPYRWQQSSVINKLRIFFALICLEAFLAGSCRNMFGDDSTSAPMFNWIRGRSGLIHCWTARWAVSEWAYQLLLPHCWDVRDFFGVKCHGKKRKPAWGGMY